MSSIFLDRLVNRATGKQPQIPISPALTADFIPEPFRLPEGTYPAYRFRYGEPPDFSNPNKLSNSRFPQQTNSNSTTARARAENLPTQDNEKNILANPTNATISSAETERRLIKENKERAESLKEANDESPLDKDTRHDNKTKVNLPSKRTSPTYLPEEKVRSQGIVVDVSRQNVFAQTDSASSPNQANTNQRGSITQETMQRTPSTQIETVESPSKASAKIRQISTNSRQNLPLEGEGKPSLMPEHAKQAKVEVSRQLARSAEETLKPESPKLYPQTPAMERWPRLQKAEETTVTIHIGRIEVHATKEQEKPASPPRGPILSLSDYLKQRSEET